MNGLRNVNPMNKLCIYHGGCTDGIAAAWAVHFADQGYEFYPGVYQEEPPWHLISSDTHVLLVDFSYKRPVLEQIIGKARRVTIFDHHKSAQEDIEDLLTTDKIDGCFDMGKCGAMLAWEAFHLDTPYPPLLPYIDAHDRWLDSRDPFIISAVRSYSHAPEDSSSGAWRGLMYEWRLLMYINPERLRKEGMHIHRYYRTLVEQAKLNARVIVLGDVRIPAVNVPYFLTSDVAGELAEENDGFGATWHQKADGSVKFSLRARKGHDVSGLAESYGGGGHEGAAGFRVTAEKAATILFRGNHE